MEEFDDLEKEQSDVDNYIIITCITLLSAYVIFVTLKEQKNNFLIYSLIISTFSLMVTLFQFLWHKFRIKIRQHFFQKEKKALIEKYADKISDFAETVMDSTLKVNLIKALPDLDKIQNPAALIGNIVKTPLIDSKAERGRSKSEDLTPFVPYLKQAFDITSSQTRGILDSYLRNLTSDLTNAHISAYRKPLSERFALIKCYFDLLSKTTRYYFFVIGVVFFFISIFLSLI